MQKKNTYATLRRFKNGCEESFQQIFHESHSLIYHYCLKFIRREDMAQEATADVFIKFWQKRDIIDPHRPVEALLYKIARDTAYNYLKKIASSKRLKEEYIARYPVVEHRNAELIFLAKEQKGLLAEIIDTLPPKRQEIFKMHFYEGVDNQGIARRLRISPHTVKSQLVKARHYLREKLSLAARCPLSWLILLMQAW